MNCKPICVLAILFNVFYGQVSFEQGKEILLNIKESNLLLPENEIIGAEISIIDDNQLSAIITCDTLINENSSSAILTGNVVAQFYESEIFIDANNNGIFDKGEEFDDENKNNKFDRSFLVSQLKSDIAYYNQNSSLRAQKNVTVERFDDFDKSIIIDELSFLDPKDSEIIWHRKYGTIASDKSFILRSEDGSCMSGNTFESNVDLSNVKVVGVEGGNYCK